MRECQKFTLGDVQRHLQRLDIPFSTSGSSSDFYAFKSLHKIERFGIYFLVTGISKPPEIENSIIIYPEPNYAAGSGNVTLQVEEPQLAFYRLMEAMVGEREKPRGIHPSAVIGDGCEIDPNAYIGPFCVLEGCSIKAGAQLHSHITIMRGTTIEEDVTIESHSTIGATGVAWIWEPATRRRIIQPQTGYTIIGRDSFLGTDVTVVRGSVNETTSIGEGCVIAHGSKIGHGSQIGSECHFANNVSIAGNVTLGRQCFLGSGSVVRPQTQIAERTVIGAGAVVVKHIEEPDLVLMGSPAKPAKPASGKMSGVPKPLDS